MMYHDSTTTCASTNLILVVASDRDLGFILTMTLREEMPYEVLLVADGREAIEFCRLIRPQLVLFDEQLSGMQAVAIYERLCQNVEERPIPGLLLVTCHPEDEGDWQYLHWIKKPFHWDKLLQTVKGLLGA